MCGIVGWIDWEQDLTNQGPVIECMADRLQHRGPDAKGCWLSSRAVLAHRRLIVIDPLGGVQPMAYVAGDHRYVLTYNGEVYNFRELRQELILLGHAFSTRSDTEVILHAYVEWGEACIQQFNGTFAFGLWDEYKQQLLLARDHLGVKPLFYAQRGSAILFASELKALLAHPLIKAEVDAEGLAEILNYSLVRTPGCSVFRNIYELRPAHTLLCTRNSMRALPYWHLSSAAHPHDLETTVEQIKLLLEDTVRHQLVADVPLVTLLSGGLDSSGLTALAANELRREERELCTYSIDFVDSSRYFRSNTWRPELDEPWSRKVAAYVGTRHSTVTVDTAELLEHILTPLYAHDLPATGQLESSLYLLFKAMKRNATVALSGESADEVFGGYAWFHTQGAQLSTTFPWFMTTQRVKENALLLSAEARETIQLEEYVARRYREALTEVPGLPGEDALAARMREVFYLHLTRLLPTLLERKDRMSMAVGLEVRVPYCDYRLVQYLWNVPWEMKTIDHIEKGLLRRCFSGLLPDDVRNRRKSAYPAMQHPAYLQAVREWVLQIVSDPNAAIRPFIDTTLVRALAEGKLPVADRILVGIFDHLIQVNAWLKDYHVVVC